MVLSETSTVDVNVKNCAYDRISLYCEHVNFLSGAEVPSHLKRGGALLVARGYIEKNFCRHCRDRVTCIFLCRVDLQRLGITRAAAAAAFSDI